MSIIRKRPWVAGALSFQKRTVLISFLREAPKAHLSLSFFSPLVLVFQLLMRKTSRSQEMAVTHAAAECTTAMSELLCT